MNRTTFGRYLRDLRNRRGVSQRDLADAVGIDFTYISKIENDKTAPPSEATLDALADLLHADPEDMKARAGCVNREMLSAAMIADPRIGTLVRALQSQALSERQIYDMLRVAEAQR